MLSLDNLFVYLDTPNTRGACLDTSMLTHESWVQYMFTSLIVHADRHCKIVRPVNIQVPLQVQPRPGPNVPFFKASIDVQSFQSMWSAAQARGE